MRKKKDEKLAKELDYLIRNSRNNEAPPKVLDAASEKPGEESLEADRGEIRGIKREISNQNSFTRALLDAIPVPVFFKDRRCRYLGCNNSFTLMMGLKSEEIEGKKPDEIWPEEFSAEYERKDLEILKDRKAQEYEFQVRDRSGMIRDVIYSKNVFFDEDGRPAGIVGAFMEITERKKAEAALHKVAGQARGLDEFIPICAGCKRIQELDRPDKPWVQPDEYIGSRFPGIRFSHGMCPECMKRWYPEISK